jgi:long-chain acyl-CoA synthetase
MLQRISISKRSYALLALKSMFVTHTNTLTYKQRMEKDFNDGIDLMKQSIEINPIEHIHRCTLEKDADIWTLYKTMCPNVRTLGDALQEGFIASNDGPCIGFLESVNGRNVLQWLSYSTVIERTLFIGSYLSTRTKLTSRQSKVAILSSNRPEYLFVEHACYMYGFVVVSLHTTYDSATIQDILQKTEAEVLVVDNFERIQSIENELLTNRQLKEILVMDEISYDEKNKIRPLSSILKSMKKTDICQRPIIDPEDIATLILTSGTTGNNRSIYAFTIIFCYFRRT